MADYFLHHRADKGGRERYAPLIGPNTMDVLPNEATGFKSNKIWNMLYDFQKDAALAIINKLEKYNGCILADSVGPGNRRAQARVGTS